MIPKHQEPLCIYCDERIGSTRDHIPPRGLFAKPRPNLITVPCCELCRRSQSLDDEYFIRAVSLKNDTVESASVASARNAALRALRKPGKAGFAHSLLRTAKDIPTYTPAGIYLGQSMSFNVDLKRLVSVIERTTRGLHFHEFGTRIADKGNCRGYVADVPDASFEVQASVEKVWKTASTGKRHDFGDSVFTYWVQRVGNPEELTLWAFLVYGSIRFVAFSGPLPIG